MNARAVLALLAALSLAAPALGQQDSLEQAERRRLDQLQRQAREKREAATRLRGQEKSALGELKRTERELTLTRRRLQQLANRRRNLDQQLDQTRASLERSIASLTAQRERLRKRLRSLYKYGPARELEYLLSTRSFGQLMARWDFLTMVAQQDRYLLEGVRAEKEQVEADKMRLETNLTQVDQNAKATTKESAKLSTLRSQRARNVKAIQTQREAYEAAAADLERAARRTQALLARLERQRREEADRARAQGRNPQPYSGDFARGEGALDWPVRGPVVGRFGLETHPRFGTKINNDGIDIQVAVGTPVSAVAKGRVDFANDDYEGMGGLVVLNHGDGYFTVYGHLSEVSVRNAQDVPAGATIGRSGETGSLKGPVLHFEVRKGSTALNPESWLR